MRNIGFKTTVFEEDIACELDEYVEAKVKALNVDLNTKIHILKMIQEDMDAIIEYMIKDNNGEV